MNWEELPYRTTGKLTFYYPVGAASAMVPGVAHLLEHLIASRIAPFVTEITAKTTRDLTEFTMIATVTQLKQVLHFLSTLCQLQWNEDEVQREIRIVLRELDQFYLNTRLVYLEQLQAAVFGGHGYGCSILGNKDSLSEITTECLNAYTRAYPAPIKIEGSAPWNANDMLDYMQPYVQQWHVGSMEQQTDFSEHRYGGYALFDSSVIAHDARSIDLQCGGWRLNDNKAITPSAASMLVAIWQKRFDSSSYANRTNIHIRMFMYEQAGIITFDSSTATFAVFEQQIPQLLSLMQIPITEAEYKSAELKLIIEYVRKRENLLTRPVLDWSNWQQQLLDLQQLQFASQLVIDQLKRSIMVGLSTDRSILSTYQPYTLLHTNESKQLMSQRMYTHSDQNRVRLLSGIRVNEYSQPQKFLANQEGASFWQHDRLCSGEGWSSNTPYFHMTYTPLAERYHMLYRIGSPRLLQKADLPSKLYANGMIEAIRYEGNETIIHLSFFRAIDVLHSIQSMCSAIHLLPYDATEIAPVSVRPKRLEDDLKWNVYEALKDNDLVHCSADQGLLLKGISLAAALPSAMQIEIKDAVKKTYEVQSLNSACSNDITYDRTDRCLVSYESNWDGIAVVYPIPFINRATFIVQEAAFGLTEQDMDTLEKRVREDGLAYRIVQSIIVSGSQYYHYFGVQCGKNERLAFVAVVKRWLIDLQGRTDWLEKWARTRWGHHNAKQYYSVSQFLRAADRLVYYDVIQNKYSAHDTLPNINSSNTLVSYLQHMVAQQPVLISFECSENGGRYES